MRAFFFSKLRQPNFRGDSAHMLDPFSPDFLPLRDLIKELPVEPAPAIVCRWHLRGANGRKLAVLRVGRLLYSTRAELRNFLNESQGIATPRTDAERDIETRLLNEGLIDVPAKSRKRRRPVASHK
jgi:hypothetical protein